MLRNQLVLVDNTEDVAARDEVALLEVERRVQPLALSIAHVLLLLLPVQRGHIGTTGNERGL